MKPLNRAERTNAFLGFLLFFLLTIGVIIAVVFFSIEVPVRENEQLRNTVSALESEKELSNAFADAMKEAVDELNKYDVTDEKRELTDAINQNVEMRIRNMNDLISKMPKGDTSVYALVIQSLRDLNEAKTKLRKLDDEKRYAQHQ